MVRKLASFFIGVSLVSSAAFAQSQIGGATLNGTVTDPSGAGVPGAKVTARQTATGLERIGETSSAGLYNFSSLPVGSYDLTVEANGFKVAKAGPMQLGVGAVSTIDVRLEVGTTQETITVTAEVPVVETTRSQTSTSVDSRSVSELPINGRNFLNFVVLTPGVVIDPTRGGDLSFGGQRGTANSIQVDGTDSNNVFFGQSTGRAGSGRNPYSFSQDAVQEFQVNTNAFAAEIGRAGGGVINVITKSGTNDFHGTAFWFFRDRAMNANTFANNRTGARKGAYHYNQFGGNLGGPIAKNKAFFFFDYDGQRNSEPITVVFGGPAAPSDPASQAARQTLSQYLGQYPRSLNNNVYLAKFDVSLTDNQRLTVRYNANRFKGVNFENSGPTSALEHTGNSDVTTDNFSGNHTAVLSPATVLESRFTYTRDDEPGQANSTNPEAIIRQAGQNVISIGRNSFSPRFTNAKTYQWVESLSHVRGRHAYKLGLDFIWQSIDNFFPGNFSGVYTFNSYADFNNKTPITFTQAFAGANTDGALTKPNVQEYAFFAQDSWRVTDRLTLNYGVRYDVFKYANPTVKNENAALLASGLDTSRINLDTNNLAARFGFAYNVGGGGRTVIRGGYGNYYGRTPAIMTGTAMSQNGIQVQTYTLTSGFPAYPAVLSAPPTVNRTPDIYVFAKDYVQPISHQWSLNVERQLGRSYAVTVGYLGVRGAHLSRTRDINLFPSAPVQGSFADGTPVTFMRHSGRVNPAFGRISVFDSGADSIYHGGFIQLNKRLSQSFQVLTSYTFSKVLDSKPDFTSVVVGVDDVKNPQDTTAPNLDRGRGNADIRHRFVFSGIWDINYGAKLSNPVARAILRGYQFSLISSVQSGRPYTVTVSGDPNNDQNTATDRPPAVGRNTIEGPNFMAADIRVTRDIVIVPERANLRIIFEAFNVTNRANFTAINTGQYTFAPATRIYTPTPAATFLQPTGTTSDPRILQVAAKITF